MEKVPVPQIRPAAEVSEYNNNNPMICAYKSSRAQMTLPVWVRLSGPSAAAIWSQFLNKQVRYADIPLEAFEEQLRQIFPAWLAKDLRLMFQGYEDRGFAPSNADVASLTSLIGHAPRRYEDFVRQRAAGGRT